MSTQQVPDTVSSQAAPSTAVETSTNVAAQLFLAFNFR